MNNAVQDRAFFAHFSIIRIPKYVFRLKKIKIIISFFKSPTDGFWNVKSLILKYYF